jgi:hypothetical protein
MAAGAAGEYIFDFFQEGKIREQRDKAPVSGQTQATGGSTAGEPDVEQMAQSIVQAGGRITGTGQNKSILIPYGILKAILKGNWGPWA